MPKHDPATGRVWRAPIQEGDQATLWTFARLDDVAQLELRRRHAPEAPDHDEALRQAVPAERSRSRGASSRRPRSSSVEIFARRDPGARSRATASTSNALRQGSFFTHQGKIHVPGTSSYATPRELMRFMLKMEQGKLVDEFSSREIKRLLYITERRIRYGSSGVLRPSAVYFKSGSLYSCQPEEGFVCKKYHGNKRNYMNSLAIIETPAGQNQLFYMATVLSNVLRKELGARPPRPGPRHPRSARRGSPAGRRGGGQGKLRQGLSSATRRSGAPWH